MKMRIFTLVLALLMICMAGCQTQTNPSGSSSSAPASSSSSSTPAPTVMNMQELFQQLTTKMPEMLPMDETMMLNFCGVKAEDCKQAVMAVCGDGLRTDELWLLEAVDAEALARLEQKAQTRLQVKADEAATYSPEQLAVVQKAKVIVNGNYLIVLVSPDVDALEAIYRTAAGLN